MVVFLHFFPSRHTGMKPFSCSVCHKRFPTRINLKTHQKTHGNRSVFHLYEQGIRGFFPWAWKWKFPIFKPTIKHAERMSRFNFPIVWVWIMEMGAFLLFFELFAFARMFHQIWLLYSMYCLFYFNKLYHSFVNPSNSRQKNITIWIYVNLFIRSINKNVYINK